MDERDRTFVEFVYRHPHESAATLAEEFGVSARTIRNWVARANRVLDGIASIVSDKGTYVVEVSDADGLAALVKNRFSLWSSETATSRQRIARVMMLLFESTGWYTLSQLSSKVYVTERALSEEIRSIDKMLAGYGLALERRPHYGMRIVGDERDARRCLSDLIVREDFGDADLRLARNVPLAGGLGVMGLLSAVDETAAQRELEIPQPTRVELVERLSVGITRYARGCAVRFSREELDLITASSAYQAASVLASRIAVLLGQDLPEDEIAYIAVQLAACHVFASAEGHAEKLTLTARQLAQQIIEEVSRTTGVALGVDSVFREELAAHLAALLVRQSNGLSLDSPHSSEICREYPLAASMAIGAAATIEGTTGIHLVPEEVSHLALPFALALERRKLRARKKRVLVICTQERGAEQLLLELRWRRLFGDLIEDLVLCDVWQADAIDYASFDCVFSVGQCNLGRDVPMHMTSFSLEASDVALIRELLS